ncbi:dorsalin-1-like [Diadema antillarum]|uniref:dorsalin-1-like n=1 Tax=Diadema antillarum TaxID=105358 RepID=UPI003A8877F2
MGTTGNNYQVADDRFSPGKPFTNHKQTQQLLTHENVLRLSANRVTSRDSTMTGSEVTSSGRNISPTLEPDGSSVIPAHMIDLYRRFSGNRLQAPYANVIRSFFDQGETPTELRNHVSSEERGRQHSKYDVPIDNCRGYNFSYVVSIPASERVIKAQLRFFVANRANNLDSTAKFIVYTKDDVVTHKLSSHFLNPSDSEWIEIDISESIQKAMKRRRKETKFGLDVDATSNRRHLTIHLRLHIRLVDAFDGRCLEDGGVEILRDATHNPLLLVYSDDSSPQRSKTRKQDVEIDELIHREREMTAGKSGNASLPRIRRSDGNMGKLFEPRRRRALRRNFCRRREMQVNFDDIGWGSWIIFPKEYRAYRCEGKCLFPLTDHWTPTKHAIIQTLMHHRNLLIDRACCVPTKLEAISILYLDDAAVPTYKYAYDGMVVSECGCR